MQLLLIHAGATCFLAGLCWLVQVVVYPSFFIVGPTDAWTRFHDQHGRRLAGVIAVPWATQGVSLAVLLVQHDRPLPLLGGAAVCAAGPVLLTVGLAVPLHDRLGSFDADVVRQLLRVNALRTVLWTSGAVFSLLLLAR
jgi:hypothetical protein